MDSTGGPELRSTEPAALDSLQFTDEIRRLMSVPQDNASSFTALLELPAPQAVHLLHSPESTEPVNDVTVQPPVMEDFKGSFHFSSDSGLFKRAVMLSAFAAAHSSPATASNSSSPSPAKPVKTEPVETVSSHPSISDPTIDKKPNNKRKEREKKAKGSSKKSTSEADDEKLPYVHVRARRGQATDSHSLAERARREKINARMKLLQELVPGCNKISGTALILDEIINHVQSLQRHVEYLSMRLAAANPTIDFNLDTICGAEGGSAMCGNFPNMIVPLMWPEVQVNGIHQQFQQQRQFEAVQPHALGTEEVHHDYINPENSLMSYGSSTNSAMLQSNMLKMEL